MSADLPEETMAVNDDSCADAKAAVAIVAIIVTSVCFWLLGR